MKNPGNPPGPDEMVSIRLSNHERLLLINETLVGSDPELINKLRLGMVEGDSLVFHFTLEELEQLAGYVAEAANHAESETLEEEFDKILARIDDIFCDSIGEETLADALETIESGLLQSFGESEQGDFDSNGEDGPGESVGEDGVKNRYLNRAILKVVDNQLKDLDPPETRQTYDRLRAEGFSDIETKQLIGCVVASEIFEVLRNNEPYSRARFVRALSRLPNLPED